MTDETHELTIEATGDIETNTIEEGDGLTATRTRTETVTAELPLDADRLYDSDIAKTHQSGVTIPTADVAEYVARELDAVAVEPSEWDVVVRGPLNDWQHVALGAAKQRRGTYETNTIETALDVLETMHVRYAESDRPALAALNIDESYEAGRREELLTWLASAPGVETDADADADAYAAGDFAPERESTIRETLTVALELTIEHEGEPLASDRVTDSAEIVVENTADAVSIEVGGDGVVTFETGDSER